MTHDSLLGFEPGCSIRSYCGEYAAHEHAHAQIMFSLNGRLDLEIAGRQTFSDTSCGLIIPAGVSHAFRAERSVRMFVFDAPRGPGVDRVRRFAVTPDVIAMKRPRAGALELSAILDAPRIVSRRGIDLELLAREVESALHESWPTARMAGMFCLSGQRFHARLVELTGLTPQGYLRSLRLDRATRCLRQGRTLESVARTVGYCSASALAFALKRDRHVGARSIR
jgi:transcriptional regulator GlxA family with amidase domain